MRRFTRKAEGYTLVELLVVMAIVGMVAAGIVGVYQVSQGIYTRATALEDAQLGARSGLDRMAGEFRLIGSYWIGASGAGNAITAATPTSITFMANADDSSVINGAEATPSSTATGTSVSLSLTSTATADVFKVYAANPETNNDYIYIANGGRREVRRITDRVGNTLTLTPALSSSYPAGSIVRDVKRVTYTRNANATSTCPTLTCLTRTQGGDAADPIVGNVVGLTFTYFDTTGGALGTNPTASAIREIQMSLTTQGADGSRRTMTSRVRPRNLP
jgi:prepilin-type N-terminal cleavage/methylation domain-containing protein